MANGNGEKLKKKIVDILGKHPEGLTIQDLTNIIGAHRQTITKYVLVLEATGTVYRRIIGSASLHYLKSKFKDTVKEMEKLEKMKERLVEK